MAKRKYAAIGDTVKIVIPKRFIRCGYPLTSEILRNTRGDEIDGMVRTAWRALWRQASALEQAEALKGPTDDIFGIRLDVAAGEIPKRVYSLLDSAACSYLLEKEGWGGRNRKLYEKDAPELEGATVEITKKRIVQTGEYEPASYSRSYYDEGDWEPAYLGNAQGHCIYTFQIVSAPNIHKPHSTEFGILLPDEILATNCERMEQPNEQQGKESAELGEHQASR